MTTTLFLVAAVLFLRLFTEPGKKGSVILRRPITSVIFAAIMAYLFYKLIRNRRSGPAQGLLRTSDDGERKLNGAVPESALRNPQLRRFMDSGLSLDEARSALANLYKREGKRVRQVA